MMAFRDCYGRLHELRSLAPNNKMIALTATATKLTKATILSILLMDKPFEIQNVQTSQMLLMWLSVFRKRRTINGTLSG